MWKRAIKKLLLISMTIYLLIGAGIIFNIISVGSRIFPPAFIIASFLAVTALKLKRLDEDIDSRVKKRKN